MGNKSWIGLEHLPRILWLFALGGRVDHYRQFDIIYVLKVFYIKTRLKLFSSQIIKK